MYIHNKCGFNEQILANNLPNFMSHEVKGKWCCVICMNIQCNHVHHYHRISVYSGNYQSFTRREKGGGRE